MSGFAKPRIFVSRCLGLEACRWNGELIRSEVVDSLLPLAEVVSCCPEKEIGLGVPRDPVRVVLAKGRPTLLQPNTGRDCTEAMTGFAREYLAGLGEVDGFLLKGRSPSCGLVDVKHYTSTKPGASSRRGAGFFGAAAAETHPLAAREDEGRLRNFTIREHFLTSIYTLAAFRSVAASGRMGALVDFQARHKLLLMACSQARMRTLGRITANTAGLPAREVISAYGRELALALQRKPSPGAHVNVLLHAFGYFSPGPERQGEGPLPGLPGELPPKAASPVRPPVGGLLLDRAVRERVPGPADLLPALPPGAEHHQRLGQGPRLLARNPPPLSFIFRGPILRCAAVRFPHPYLNKEFPHSLLKILPPEGRI